MTITGEDILMAALDRILEPGTPQTADRDIDTLARHSAIVLDNLNQVPETVIGGSVNREVALAAGQNMFTWGPGGNIDGPVPVDITYWSVIDDAGIERARGSRLATVEEWASFQSALSRGRPEYVYWPRTLLDSGRYEFFVYPTPDSALTLKFYARIAKLDRISRNQTYELDPGRAEFLVLELAKVAGPVFNFPVPPEVYTAAQVAAERLSDNRDYEAVQEVSSPRFLIGEFWDRYRRWGAGYR